MSAVPKRSISIHPSRMKHAEHTRNDWTIDAEVGTTIEDVMEPGYFAHMAELMQPFDHVNVRMDDGTWAAYLIVTGTGRNWARVHLDRKIDLIIDQSAPLETVRHKVDWKGPHSKFAVIRVSDGAKVKEGCTTRAEAEAWLTEHEKTPGI